MKTKTTISFNISKCHGHQILLLTILDTLKSYAHCSHAVIRFVTISKMLNEIQCQTFDTNNLYLSFLLGKNIEN